MSGAPRALLLDLDGVLFDSEPVHRRAWEACLAELGVALPGGWYAAQRGRSLAEIAASLVGAFAPGVSSAELGARKRARYRALAAGLPPFAGVAEALTELRVRAAVVTSSSRDDALALLRGSPLPTLLEAIVTGDEVAAPKPDPAVYVLAMRRLALAPEACVAVEDSDPGIRAARAAGLRVVAVAPGPVPPPGAVAARAIAAEAIRLAAATLAS